MSKQPSARQKQIRLLIHGEDGLFPFLSPHILQKYFHSDDPRIQNHLILGVAVKETCVVPIYQDASERNTKRKKQSKNSDAAKQPHKHDGMAPNSSIGQNNQMFSESVEIEGLKRKTPSKKPIGFSFKGVSTSKYLRILPRYRTIAVPTFDLLDDINHFNDACIERKAKSSKQNSHASPTQILSTHNEISLCTPKGMQRITPELYITSVHGLECDSFVSLFDQVHSTDSIKRKKTCGKHTETWLNRCLIQSEEVGEGRSLQKAFASLVCQVEENEFKESIDNIISHEKKLSGVVLVGWHHIVSKLDRVSILRQISNPSCFLSKEILPRKDIAVLAVPDLNKVLDAVRGGANIIGTTIPASLARSKLALMLNLDSRIENTRDDNCEEGEKLKKLDNNGCRDIACVSFRRDTSVLISGCGCPACSQDKYSRAYIHHLIKCKELLADILLFGHNLYQLILLCEKMSDAMKEGHLEQFLKHIESQLQ